MKDREKNNIIHLARKRLEGYLTALEINNEVFSVDKLHIPLLTMDFPPATSVKFRNNIAKQWEQLIPTLDNIKSLSFRYRIDENLFEAICKMKNLECLTFWTSNIKDISAISKLKQLKRLELNHFSKLEDIAPIKDLQNLEILTISKSMNIVNYEVIGELKNLIGLAINGDAIAPKNLRLKSLKPFSGLKKLEHLNLESTIVIDESYDTLLEMDSLKRFDITTTVKKPLRDRIKEHPVLDSGFFVDYDFENNRFYDGKAW
ncbi:leucine-rich repeat domain-containing protein [Sphingobacterium faecale]|uniref:Disease resistance R13L4/SHOC-2-like LRR domain-containing protein n=1 Tax=Sphingobacterium faecale TaxID=2803775 RepID=A0ABS1R8M9_9SPHI|nr:hypothetical protein [Sphingobacterium faecale]MBL1411080.1 hypothetical protein [Sphingobacterium faecale]